MHSDEPAGPPPPAEPPVSLQVYREFVALAAISITAIILFIAAQTLAAESRSIRRRTAAVWSDAGHRFADQGDWHSAASAFHKATINAHDPAYVIAYADALAREGRDDQAQLILRQQLDDRPDDADVNLRLARIFRRQHDVTASTRRYRASLNAATAGTELLRTRMEFIDMLFEESQVAAAVPELIIASAESESADDDTKIGDWLMRAGEEQRGRDVLARARRRHKANGR